MEGILHYVPGKMPKKNYSSGPLIMLIDYLSHLCGYISMVKLWMFIGNKGVGLAVITLINLLFSFCAIPSWDPYTIKV